MPSGRQSKALRPDQIERLKKYQRLMYAAGKGGSIPELKLAMGSGAQFKWQVLQRALHGLPIWVLNHDFIVEWLDANCPAKAAAFDGKAAAAAGEFVHQERD